MGKRTLRTSVCRSCGARITWIKTASGQAMPCEATPVYYNTKAGNSDRVITRTGQVIACKIVAKPEEADNFGYKPHWSSCDNPSKFRKGKNGNGTFRK